MRYGEIFHEPKASEISRHISQLTSVISDLFLEAPPLDHFPIDKINEIATFLHQHNRKRHAHAQVSLVSKLVWSVAVHELELQSDLAGISTLGKYVLAG